ncbi:MAG: hypothetical protein ACTSQJ_11160 [Promethearchaeota archaeon]
MSKNEEKINMLTEKFSNIKAIRERIIGDASNIGQSLKQYLAQRKALSPEGMVKNIKSITSFLENFARMMQNLGSKLNTLTGALKKIKDNLDKIQMSAKAKR